MKWFINHSQIVPIPCKAQLLLCTLFGALSMVGCRDKTSDVVLTDEFTPTLAEKNLLLEISKDKLGDLKWMNTPKKREFKDGVLIVTTASQTDFFINPEDLNTSASAPFLFKEVSGDFVAIARVTPDMSSRWNAAALMVILDETHWIKFGFENSDATGPGIVSVVTRGTSDDANGPVLKNIESIWLKLIRKGQSYSMHWSYNGNDYYMARLTAMPEKEKIRVGIEAQCPDDSEAVHKFEHFSVESITVKDIRKGK